MTGQSYSMNVGALDQQEQLLNALQGQGGIQNQSNVYNQLQGVANGTGPNPAQAMLAQQTGQNIQAQGALMAGQRGASANVGLEGRQIAQQGAATQQQAVGQGATLQANQSLGALGQMGNIANTQAGNQIGATAAYTAANQAQEGNLLNALGQYNATNAGLANTQMQGQQGLLGGGLNAAGAALGVPAAHGGMIPKPMASGGMTGPQSSFGQFLTTVVGPSGGMSSGPNAGAQSLQKGLGRIGGAFASDPDNAEANASYNQIPENDAHGGMVDVALSPGEKEILPGNVKDAAGGLIKALTVPGKAKVKGDSLKNDTYNTKVPAGTVIVPRTKANDPKKTSSFVQATLAKRGRK